MTDPIAALTDASMKPLNGSISLATALLLLPIVVSALFIFLWSNEAKTLPGFVRFVVPVDTLTHVFTRADLLFWISRKFLMLLVALLTGASIAIACGHASHAALAAIFGDAGHVSDHQTVAIPALLMITALAYDILYHLYQSLQHRSPVLWELQRMHHSAEVMVSTTKGWTHPIDDRYSACAGAG